MHTGSEKFPKEAVPIDPNNKRQLSTDGARSLNTTHAQTGAPGGKGGPKKKKRKKKITAGGIARGFLKFLAGLLCVCVILGSIACVILAMYVVQVTEDTEGTLDLDLLSTAQTTIFYDKDGVENTRISGADNRSIWVPLENIPENLQNAVVAIEDKDFWTSHGVNFKRTLGAVINELTDNALYGSQQGASTIEQQLVKNITEDNGKDYMRKVREIFRALGLARKYSKETILEAYLNTLPLTSTIHGVQYAANEYFGKDVSELSLAECATLACISKNPTNYNPYSNPENLLTRRNYCLSLMRDQGYITAEECTTAQNEPVRLVQKTRDENAAVVSNNSYFIDACYEQLIEVLIDTGNCADRKEAVNMIQNGGLRVYTTLDPERQQAMEQIMLNEDGTFPALEHDQEIETNIPEGTEYAVDEETGLPLDMDGNAVFGRDAVPSYVDKEKTELKVGTYKGSDGVTYLQFYERVHTEAAMASLDYDGNVLAIVGGVGQKKYDLGTNRATSYHQTGSTMKPIGAYCLGIEYGVINYSSPIPDTPFYTAEQKKVPNESGTGYRDWPTNFTGPGSGKSVLVYDALQQSLNTVAVRVGSYVGVDNIFDFVHDTLNCSYLVEADCDYSPIVLGGQSYGISTVQLAGAYSIFYDGTFTTPHFFTEVYDYAGNPILSASDFVTTAEAISPQTATIMNKMLKNVLVSGTAKGMQPNTPSGKNAAAKTGTTSNFKDYTFCGMTPYSVTTVWWGFDQPTDMSQFGYKSGKPTQTAWKAYIEATESDLPEADFPVADGVVTKQFDPATGYLVTSGGKTGYYTEDNLPEKYSDTGDSSYLSDALDAYNSANPAA
ncbi:MAG: transglycosylase domain-containing protein [Gemmiger sp.]